MYFSLVCYKDLRDRKRFSNEILNSYSVLKQQFNQKSDQQKKKKKKKLLSFSLSSLDSLCSKVVLKPQKVLLFITKHLRAFLHFSPDVICK